MHDHQPHLFLKALTIPVVTNEAKEFAQYPIFAPSLSGPIIGEVIEHQFIEYLRDQSYDVGVKEKSKADLPRLNVDIKALRVRGKRGGAAKIHGYSKGGPPVYSLLLFTYDYNGECIEFVDVFFIPNEQVNWVRAEHYLFSIPDKDLRRFQV